VLLGVQKQHIKSVVDFTEDCFSDIDRSVVVIDGAEASKVFPFYLSKNEYIELEFNSCTANGVVVKVSVPIAESKFESLKKFYSLAYGEPQIGSHKNHFIWSLSKGSVSLIKLSKSRYAVLMAL